MATIKGLLDRLEALDTDAICVETVQESAPAMTDKQREQLYSGETAQGTEIKPPYRPYTVAVKQLKGQPTDRVTLRDTGAFYQGVYVRVDANTINTGSTDGKEAKLREKYGEGIFGLNDKFGFEVVQETMRPIFKGKIEAATGLTMR